MWNVDFSTLYKEFTLRLINAWERDFLNQINYNVSVQASAYASYYFKLRELETVAKEQENMLYVQRAWSPLAVC